MFFFFKQKTAYELRISDWSSDVCSSDLIADLGQRDGDGVGGESHRLGMEVAAGENIPRHAVVLGKHQRIVEIGRAHVELQSLMRISYAVFCLKKKNKTDQYRHNCYMDGDLDAAHLVKQLEQPHLTTKYPDPKYTKK